MTLDRDRRIAAALLAAGPAGGLYALLTAALARRLVGGVNRQQVGAILFGAVAVALVPVALATWLVAWRIARRVVARIPRPGPLPLSVVVALLLAAAVAAVAAGALAAEPGAPPPGPAPATIGSAATVTPAPLPPSPPAASRAADNLVLVIVDTLRGDRLGVAGYHPGGRSLTPRLDQLAAAGAWFERAWAQAPNTARSVPSLLTSRYPADVPARDPFDNFPVTRDDAVTLFEVLAAAGLRTLAFASHYYFTVNPGIRQGIDEVDNRGAVAMEEDGAESAAPRVVPRAAAALAALGDSGERFAMLVHLFEPHSDYLRHPEAPCPTGSRLSDRYDCEVAFVDLWVGRLVDAIDRAGLGDRTLVVVVADHGEGFGEHRLDGQRLYYHGRSLYEELLRVPLITRLPGAAPRRVAEPVMLIDVAPTALDALGVAAPPQFQGRSLLPALRGEPLAPRPAFAELLPAPYWDRRAAALLAADGHHKAIQQLAPDRRLEIYDLADDPGETRDLADDDPALASQLGDTLAAWLDR